jgi:DNA-binding response OmpR family regulator/DNA-binding ferritin-like protein
MGLRAHGLKNMNMDDLFRNGRFLVVDDFEQMRVSFKGMLSGFGATYIKTAATGEEAIKYLATERFDVVICDYNLGEGKDGQQVLEEARHLGYLGHACTFFMVTAESHISMVLGALEHQPDEYMVKPINREAFQLRLTGTLKRKKKLKPIDAALVDGDKARAIGCCMEQANGDLKYAHYLLKLRAELCLDTESYEDAEKIYNGLLEIRDFPWAHFGLGKVDFLRKDLERAESRFTNLIEKNQHYLEAYDWAARVKEALGDKKRAQELLQQAVKLAPKAVVRQRKLGLLALENGDSGTAERAFKAAIQWGKTSCFAASKEYLKLADIYQEKGQQAKQLQLLAEGATRFGGQPCDQVQLLCRQATVKREVSEHNDIEHCVKKIESLAREHSAELPPEVLLSVAEECYRLDKPDSAREMLKVLVGNYHDDEERVERVRQVLRDHDQPAETKNLVENISKKLFDIHSQCGKLLGAGKSEQAIEQLNDVIEQHPANRTLVLLGVKAMTDHMIEHGADQGYYFRCRQALQRLLHLNAEDSDANNALEQLSQILSI